MAVITTANSITFEAGSDYVYTLSDATAGPGQAQLYVYADQLGAGDNLTFDGSAETTASIYLTAGAGVDVLKGGQANDHFVMHDHLTAADSVDGGVGYDWLYLIGNYSAGLTFGGATIKNIESLYFGAGYSYKITLNDANIAAGQQLQIYGKDLALTDSLNVNGAAETNGSFYFDSATSRNTLIGGAQADTFYIHNGVGHGGVGTLNGGAGNDIFVFDGDLVAANSINGGSGTDSVDLSGFGSLTLTMTATTMTGIETLSLSGGTASITTHDATIAAGARLVISSDTGLTLNGSAEKNGYFTVNGSEYADNIKTGAMNDTISTFGGNDIIDGGAGADVMTGGGGNDTYYVDNLSDKVIEASNGGTDAVISSVTFNLSGQYAENLTLSGTGNINGTGNGLNNILTGNSGANILDGGTGADQMSGGLGNDTYYVDNLSDKVIEASNGGTDKVSSSVTFSLSGQYIENLTLSGTANINATGNTLNNILTGNSGANILDGGAGADQMSGGLGNDTYYVDNLSDKVIEAANGGTDTIVSSVTFNLSGQYAENLTLSGTANINATGNTLNNILTGNSGANILDGASGVDQMSGGLGNDTYYVDNLSDKVIEAANGGTDTVISSVTFNLSGQYAENLTLTGTGKIAGSGNALNNTITGNSSDNRLDGGAGVDVMTGGAGNDTYYVDNLSDKVIEAANGGTDTVISSVTFNLSGQYAENLTLTGTGKIAGSGNALNNIIKGNASNNTLNGAGGNDTLTGGTGADVFFFGAGSGKDTITDFSASQNDSLNLHAYSQSTAVITQVGSNTVIDLGGGNVITLTGTTKADVTSHITW